MTTDEQEYGPVRPDELTTLVTLLEQALHFPLGAAQPWIERIGGVHMRVVRRRGRVVAGLGIIPMGQWFGGARVPVAAISAVGVAPEMRGRGVGLRMLRSMLAEIHASGTPISVLYPSTLSFYRAAGYERAGTRMTYDLPIQVITKRDYTLEMEPVAPGDAAPLVPIYEQFARRTPGMFDRAPVMWQAILEPRVGQVNAYLITRDGQPEGYLALMQGGRQEPLRIRDFVLLSRAAGERALTMFTDYRIFVDRVTWVGSPADPLIALLPEHRYKISDSFEWVLRIVDVASALRQRGYPASLNAELHLDIQDDLLPHNQGRWQVKIADGRAEVQPGGSGRLRLGIRELAALYSGHLAPAALQFSGMLSGPDDDLALLGLVFSGPPPRLTDPF